MTKRRQYYETTARIARSDRPWLLRVIAACEAGNWGEMRYGHYLLAKLAIRNTAGTL